MQYHKYYQYIYELKNVLFLIYFLANYNIFKFTLLSLIDFLNTLIRLSNSNNKFSLTVISPNICQFQAFFNSQIIIFIMLRNINKFSKFFISKSIFFI